MSQPAETEIPDLTIDDALFIRDGRSLAFRRGSNWIIPDDARLWAREHLPYEIRYPLFGGFSTRVSRFMRNELTGFYLKNWDGDCMNIAFQNEEDAVLFKITFSELISDESYWS